MPCDQITRRSAVKPGLRFLVRKIPTGNGGKQGPADPVFSVGPPIVQELTEMEQVVYPMEEFEIPEAAQDGHLSAIQFYEFIEVNPVVAKSGDFVLAT